MLGVLGSSLAVGQTPREAVDLVPSLLKARKSIPALQATIKDRLVFSKESTSFYKRDLTARNREMTYRWAYADGRIGREDILRSEDKNSVPIVMKRLSNQGETKSLAIPTNAAGSQMGQGTVTKSRGLDGTIDLLHFGYKIAGRWIDEAIASGNFKVRPSQKEFRGRELLELVGDDPFGRPCTIWVCPSLQLFCVRHETTQADNTLLTFAVDDVQQKEDVSIPISGRWTVTGEIDGVRTDLQVGTIEAEKLSFDASKADLLKDVEFPVGSTVADVDTNRFYRTDASGKLLEFDPRADRHSREMIGGWLFIGGGLVLLGLVTRLISHRLQKRSS